MSESEKQSGIVNPQRAILVKLRRGNQFVRNRATYINPADVEQNEDGDQQ